VIFHLRRLVSMLVLALALSAAAGIWLRARSESCTACAGQDAASHDTSGWNDRSRPQSPIVGATPTATIVVHRSVQIGRTTFAPRHGNPVMTVTRRLLHPHDPPHLHTFILLI